MHFLRLSNSFAKPCSTEAVAPTNSVGTYNTGPEGYGYQVLHIAGVLQFRIFCPCYNCTTTPSLGSGATGLDKVDASLASAAGFFWWR